MRTDSVRLSSGAFQSYVDRIRKEKTRKYLETHNDIVSHERTHQTVGGAAVGTASYVYRQGPDGRFYAVGGQVNFHIPAGTSPEEALRMLQRVRLAATAPDDPSPKDLVSATQLTAAIRRAQSNIDRVRASKVLKENSDVPSWDPDYSTTPDFALVAGILASPSSFLLYA